MASWIWWNTTLAVSYLSAFTKRGKMQNKRRQNSQISRLFTFNKLLEQNESRSLRGLKIICVFHLFVLSLALEMYHKLTNNFFIAVKWVRVCVLVCSALYQKIHLEIDFRSVVEATIWGDCFLGYISNMSLETRNIFNWTKERFFFVPFIHRNIYRVPMMDQTLQSTVKGQR